MTLLENRVEGLWCGKQSAKGTPQLTADKRFRKTGGDLNVNRDDASTNYSDGQRFGDAMDYVNTIVGEGTPVVQGQPGACGYLSTMFLGADSVAVAGPNFDHTITPGAAGSYLTWTKLVGASVGPLLQQFNDCRIASLRIEASSANKICILTPNVSPSLDPGPIPASAPVKALDSGNTELPFLYTEGAGRYAIDGQVYAGQSSFALVMTDAAAPWYGDSVTPYDVSFGIAAVTLEGVTIALDAIGLQRYYQQIYGTTAPAVGAKPLTGLPGLGSYTADLKKGTNQTLSLASGTATGGTLSITVGTYGTATAIPFNVTAANLATGQSYSLDTIPGLKGKVTCTGGPYPATPIVITISPDFISTVFTFVNSLTGTTPVPLITNNGHNRGLKIEVPGVKWSPDVAVAGNPDGGATELPLSGMARAVTGQPMVRVTVRNGDSAAY